MFLSKPVLAIETSCDETSAAVVLEHRILSNVIASQVEMHRKWGGVVPEAAARAHVEASIPTISEAMAQAGLRFEELGGIAVTNRPGLVGALSVGLSAAKTLAYGLGLPLIGIHHLEGHILSVLAERPNTPFPHVCLMVSGGHTELVAVQRPGSYRLIGQTLDDAAGEAFDKGARLMGLGYPGGRAIQEAAKAAGTTRYALPKGLSGETIDFSFSGLKTAALRLVEREGDSLRVPEAAASLQDAIVSVLTERALRAAENRQTKCLTLVGGVAANEMLRMSLQTGCTKRGIEFITPPMDLCTDNAGMIGIVGSIRLGAGEQDGWGLDALANAPLPG